MTNKPPETPPSPEPLSKEEIEDVLRRLISARKQDQSDIQHLTRSFGQLAKSLEKSGNLLKDAHEKINKIFIELIAYRLVIMLLGVGYVFFLIGRNS